MELCASGRRRKDVIEEGEKFGTIVKEEFNSEDAGKMGDYVKRIQRLEDENGKIPWIRFNCYVRRPGWKSWKLAGGTSLAIVFFAALFALLYDVLTTG